MIATAPTLAEETLARLTSAAYQVALRHGLRSPFIEVELDLWRELRHALAMPPVQGNSGEDLQRTK